MPAPRRSRDRIVDEMALALCSVEALDHDDTVYRALKAAGFRSIEIARYVDAARKIAHAVRLAEAEIYAPLQYP